MTKLTKVVVFDLDGVLIDSGEANYQAFAYGLEQLGLEQSGLPQPQRQQVIDLVGLKATVMLERLGCPPGEATRIFRDFVQPHYLNHLPQLAQAMPQADRVLTELKTRGYRIFACTSGDRPIQTQALQSIGLWSHIEKMQTPQDSPYGKPDPRYLQGLFPGGPPEHFFHVEDSEAGIRMGKACGAVTIFARYGYGTLPADLTVDYQIEGLTELLAIAV